MKKFTVILIVSLLCIGTIAAQKFKSSSSSIRFYSDAPIEDIEATNTGAVSIIDLEAKTFVFSVPIEDFEFEKKLMQEHFNENYLETEKYPKAIFKGKITGWDGSEGENMVTADGEMTIHGVSNKVSIEATMDVSEEVVGVNAVFPIKLKDYKIKIPKAVFYNIAEIVEVTVSFEYAPYEKN